MHITNTGVVIIAFVNHRKTNGTAQHNALFWHRHVARNLQRRGSKILYFFGKNNLILGLFS